MSLFTAIFKSLVFIVLFLLLDRRLRLDIYKLIVRVYILASSSDLWRVTKNSITFDIFVIFLYFLDLNVRDIFGLRFQIISFFVCIVHKTNLMHQIQTNLILDDNRLSPLKALGRLSPAHFGF